jgi:ElaA protein
MGSMPKLALEWQRFEEFSAPALYRLLRFRQQIFVVEQRSPYPDLDGLDFAAWHLRLLADGELAGYLRLVPSPAARLGRVAVAGSLRGRGLGRRLMREALSFCHEHYPGQPIALTAQLHLLRFYEEFGFAATAEPFDDFGVPHINMRRPPR